MSSTQEAIAASREYGSTRGVEAYRLYLLERPIHKDKRVDQIAKTAVELAMLVDSRHDLIPNYAVLATIQVLDDEALGTRTTGAGDNEAD